MGWDEDARGVTVRTARDQYQAGEVLFCGGAWSGALLRDLDVPLRVTRQVMGLVNKDESRHIAIDFHMFDYYASAAYARRAARPFPRVVADLGRRPRTDRS